MTTNTNQFVDTATGLAGAGAAYFSLNSQDISANIRNCEYPSSWKNNEVTVFGSAGVRYNPSIVDTKIRLEMVLNQVGTTGSQTVVGAAHYAKSSVAFIFCPFGNTASNLKIYGNCYVSKYTIKAKVGETLLVDADLDVDNGATFGVVT